MTDDRDLEGLDPYDLMDTEAARIDAYLSGLDDAGWSRPSRCEGWSVRDVLAHLLASEAYNEASLNGTVAEVLAAWGARGATDLPSVNELGIRELDGRATAELLGDWRAVSATVRAAFRGRDGDDVDTSIGPYPARWQAFHLAFELAVHADDIGAPVAAAESAARNAWQAKFGRFALRELHHDFEIEGGEGTTHVAGEGIDVDLPDALFVQAVSARLADDAPIDAEARVLLSATP